MSNQMSEWVEGWLAGEDSARDVIAVKRIYIDINGGNLHDGILFSQIMYWHGKNRETGNSRLTIFHDGKYWLAKSYDDWYAECRIMGATARKCIDRMEKRGLIIKRVFKFDGAPTVHIRINWSKFEALVKDYSVSHPSDTTYQIKTIPKVKSLTETTPETTEKESAPNGTHGKSPKAKAGKVREVDPYFEAIATVWHTRAGGFIGGIKSMMLGKATGKSQYAKGNFDEPVVDPQEILDFGVWAWKRVESRSAPNNGQKPELPTYAVTIQKWFYDFRDDRRAHAITPAAPTPEAPWTNSGDYFKWRAEQLESGL